MYTLEGCWGPRMVEYKSARPARLCTGIPALIIEMNMDAHQKKKIGRVVGGCGCSLLVLIAAWLGFVIYIGIQGRGKDEEASVIIGAVTCILSVPVVLLTAAGLYFGLRKDKE